MSSSAEPSDASIAAFAKKNLEKIAGLGVPGHTVESLLQAGGAPVASTLLGAGAGAIAAPSDHRGEGAVRGAIAGGLTGLAHRAINARGAVAASDAAAALRNEQGVVDHLATQVQGKPVLPHGGHYQDVSTPMASVDGMVLKGKPTTGVDAAARASELERVALARARGAGVGGWAGQGTPVGMSLGAGGVAGATIPGDEKRAEAVEDSTHPYAVALTKEGSVSEILGRLFGRAAGGVSAHSAGGGLGLLDRFKIWRAGGLTPEHASAMTGKPAISLGTAHGVQPVPAGFWDELKGRTRELFAHNREAAGKNKLMLAQNYANGLGADGGAGGGFMRGFAGAADEAKAPMPQVFPGMGGPLPHDIDAFSAAPGMSQGDVARATSIGAGAYPPSTQFPAPAPVDPLTAARQARSRVDEIYAKHASAPEAELLKEAMGLHPVAAHGELLNRARSALSHAGAAHMGKGAAGARDVLAHPAWAGATQAQSAMEAASAAAKQAMESGDAKALAEAQKSFAAAHSAHAEHVNALHGAASAGGQRAGQAAQMAERTSAAHAQHQAPQSRGLPEVLFGDAPDAHPYARQPAAQAPAQEPPVELPPMREPEPVRGSSVSTAQTRGVGGPRTPSTVNTPAGAVAPTHGAPQRQAPLSAQPVQPFMPSGSTGAGGTTPPIHPYAQPAPSAPAPQPGADLDAAASALGQRARAEAQNPRFAGTMPQAKEYQAAIEGHAAAQASLAELKATRDRLEAMREGIAPEQMAAHQRQLDAAHAGVANAQQQMLAHKQTVDAFDAARAQAAAEAAARKAKDAATEAAAGLGQRPVAPGAQAEHGGVVNPWADKPVVDGQNLSSKIEATQKSVAQGMGQRMGSRALSGAVAGAGTGYMAADDEHKGQGALTGAAAGGALGAGIGHFDAERARVLATRPLQAQMHGVHDAAKASAAAKELAALQNAPATNHLAGAGAGAVASGLTARGEEQNKTAEDLEMHPYGKIAAHSAAPIELGTEKIAGLMSRLLTGAGIGAGLGGGAGYLYGGRTDPSNQMDFARRGALLGTLAGGAGGVFSHQLANHAMTPGMPHPGVALSDKALGAAAAGGTALLGGMAMKAITGEKNVEEEAAKSKALGTLAASVEAHDAILRTLAPAQAQTFLKVVSTDQTLAHADKQLLEEAFDTMCKTAPRLATDTGAVKSFLREVASYGTGPNYITIKNLAEAERAVSQTYKA